MLLALLVAGAGPQPPGGDTLEARIAARAARDGAEVGVAARTRTGDRAWYVNADRVFHAASTMKVAVMVELFRQAEAGRLRLDDEIPVVNRFSSIVDGSPYALDVADDSDEGEIYRAIGQRRSLRALCEAMITVSSNLATNLLIERVGVANIQKTLDVLGVEGLRVLRGVEDQKAFDRGMSNTTTARGLLRLFEAIAHGKAAGPEGTQEMIGMLSRQRFGDGIPAGLAGTGAVAAHKTGEISQIHHDAGLVYPPGGRNYAIVVLVRGVADRKVSAALIADVTRMVHAAATATP